MVNSVGTPWTPGEGNTFTNMSEGDLQDERAPAEVVAVVAVPVVVVAKVKGGG